jgi:anti-sigma factor RsiW
MKTTEMTLDLQAYVDGELPSDRRQAVEAMLSGDAEARELVEGLRRLSLLVRSHEPEIKVPASREFYWSQIQKQIDLVEREEIRRPAGFALGWLRWLVPAVGAAAVAVVVSLRPGPEEVTLAGAFDSAQTESSAVVFRSESDGVTIHWID